MARGQRTIRAFSPVAVGLSLLLLALGCVAGGVAASSSSPRDLSLDEARGGHTLARHVARSESDLQERLRREPGIAAASTYTDRVTAERVVGEALARGADRLREWSARRGRRPNLVLHYRSSDGRPIGSSLERGDSRPRPCNDALVVLRWDERRGDWYVLTSYPEVRR